MPALLGGLEAAERPLINPNPWPQKPWPLSVSYPGVPASLVPNSEVPSQWSPWGTFQPVPYAFGWDELRGAVQHTPQVDFYDASPNPWPNNGQADYPNHAWQVGEILRLRPTTSAHPGAVLPTGPGPTMLFAAPPLFSVQTMPIRATGV